MRKLCASKQVQVGFADSGAHLKNLASYNFTMCMLKYVLDAEREGQAFMSIARAVHRLSGELADWYGIDAGHIREGDRADVVVINPQGLTDEVWGMVDAPFPAFGMDRLVNRNDLAVDATIINGKLAYHRLEGYASDLGKARGYGRFLPAINNGVEAIAGQHRPAAV
jgi:N-acyl-D-aspartate/D-glutamate deacylase